MACSSFHSPILPIITLVCLLREAGSQNLVVVTNPAAFIAALQSGPDTILITADLSVPKSPVLSHSNEASMEAPKSPEP